MSVMDIYNQAFDEYSQQVYGPEGIAYNSPNKLQYDIDANAAAARVPSAIAEGAFPGAIGQGLGFLSDLAMPALALGSSPFYDTYQATQRAKQANPVDTGPYAGIVDDMEVPAGPTMGQLVNAIRNENIIDSAIGRTLGAGQNLANRFSNIGTAQAAEVNPNQATNIGNAPGIFDINQVGDPALNPGSVNVFGLDPFGVNENSIERGAVREEGAITDRGRSGAFASPGEMGAYEMIGGTPVAIGDVLGRQQALEKADFYEEPTQGINYGDLGILGTLGGLLTGSTALKGVGMFGNYKSGRTGRTLGAVGRGIGSLGSKFAGKMRGINPITGRPNTQSQYEQARDDRRQQSRVDNVAARLAAGKKTLSDPYSIAKTAAQRQQIRDGKVEGAKKDTSMGETGYGSCFIAGTKVSMADGTFKNIEYVKVGDKVKGHKEDNTVIKLDPTSLGDRKLYSFNNNQHYFFTSEHPFMTEEGWKSIKPEKTKERDGAELYDQLKGELKVGDKLVTDNGLVEITNIDSKEMNSPEMSLYNFNVSNDNSYIADGYIVHNKGGGGGKIVCTMMNERYGFGSFRNKIWMKFHEHHGPEYQKGYHAIFLPLVKIAKGEGKINTAVRKVLEHMGRHVTADMFKIMKGKKRDTLGRIYRAIFEPACHIIGKIKSALGRG